MNTVQINGLWNYLQTLSLTKRNKQWLADRLVETATSPAKAAEKDDTLLTKEEFFAQIDEALEQARQGEIYRQLPGEHFDDFLDRVAI